MAGVKVPQRQAILKLLAPILNTDASLHDVVVIGVVCVDKRQVTL